MDATQRIGMAVSTQSRTAAACVSVSRLPPFVHCDDRRSGFGIEPVPSRLAANSFPALPSQSLAPCQFVKNCAQLNRSRVPRVFRRLFETATPQLMLKVPLV